ncbi:hypothetical protein AOA80_03740 [Methanomassiliicoccales archaeon RumEn M1]|nr:hypothetical protein AOA80_03740 [Methanomassiliicoccales archaeon RumEn M1]
MDQGTLKVMVLACTKGGHSSYFIELSLFPGADRGPLDPAMVARACRLISKLRPLGYRFYHDGSLIIAERRTSAGGLSDELSLLQEVISKIEERGERPSP